MKRFHDTAILYVRSGDGGDGSRHLRREKYISKGGPDGGDGGRGGHVIFQATTNDATLIRFHFNQKFRAGRGGDGGRSGSTGADGEDLVVPVPEGTLVVDNDNGQIIGDLVKADDQLVVAEGGESGLGNMHFKSSTHQAPRISLKGGKGQERWLRLELKLVADVGLVGSPNAGKSSLMRRISAARPKVAAYPFTTLSPVLGVVTMGDLSLVAADIPGLIEGSHKGSGLGDDFLRHIERTRFLIHVVDMSGNSGDPMANFEQIRVELEMSTRKLGERPFVVAANKMDLVEAQGEWEAFCYEMSKMDILVYGISAVTGAGVDELLKVAFEQVSKTPRPSILDEPSEVVLRPGPDVYSVSVERISPETYVVYGEYVEKLVSRIDGDIPEAMDWLQRQLERLGVLKELRRSGAYPGCAIQIGQIEFEWAD